MVVYVRMSITEKLCPDCIENGFCWFSAIAARIASNPNTGPLYKSEQIAQARIEARYMMCPNLNEIDPEYEGKRDL